MRNKVKKQRMQAVAAFAVFTALLFSGCSSDVEALQEETSEDSVPVEINALLDTGTISPETRAATNKDLASDGNVVKLFLIDAANTNKKYQNQYAVPYTYSSSAGGWKSSAPFYVDARSAYIYACYDPHSVVTFSNSTVTTGELAVQSNNDNKLWYYAAPKTKINNTNPRSSFTLECAYSRLSLSLSKSANTAHSKPYKVSQVVIKPSVGNFYTKAKVDIADSSLKGTAVGNYTIDTKKMSVGTKGLSTTPDTSIDLLFPAQKLATGSGLTFELTVDDEKYSVTVPASNFNQFKKGVRHTANIQFQVASSSLSLSVQTEDWPKNPDNAGDYTPGFN